MRIVLDRSDDAPLYLQLKEQLVALIVSGGLSPGSRLPPTRDLARQLKVSRITVVNAYADLAAEGLISSHVGRGTFVTALPEPAAPAVTPPDAPDIWPPWWPGRLSAHTMLRQMMHMTHQPEVISFADGAPATEFLPVAPFREAINAVLRRDGADALQYDVAEGYAPLRAAIAHYLQEQGAKTTARQVLISSGCQQGLDLVVQVLAQPGDSILVESPTYLGALDLFEARHLRVVGVPVDEEGLRVELLESYTLKHRPKLLYIAPTFQNPTGATMPLPRRRALLEIADKYGVTVLEDGVYNSLRYEGEQLPSLTALDEREIVVHVSSFSKILLPGIRVGYLVAAEPLYERLVAAKQTMDIYTGSLDQRALHAYLAAGQLPEHVEGVRRAYRERRDTMLESARRYLPSEARWTKPQGGIYLWLKAPPDLSITQLYLLAVQHGTAFAIGSVFFPQGRAEPCLRLNFASHPPDVIREGMRRLGMAWQELQGQAKTEIGPLPAQQVFQLL
jgi:DNA-binding transcriptional MocR family regulator